MNSSSPSFSISELSNIRYCISTTDYLLPPTLPGPQCTVLYCTVLYCTSARAPVAVQPVHEGPVV